MRRLLTRAILGLPVLVATGALGTGVSAAARANCTPMSHAKDAPRLLSPCAGTTVPRGRAVVFTAAEAGKLATTDPPYLNLATKRTIVDGHLALNRDGNGIFGQMTAVPGRTGVFSYAASRQIYPSWWDNRRGTYYVQLEQVDPQVPSGIIYGPITTVRVG